MKKNNILWVVEEKGSRAKDDPYGWYFLSECYSNRALARKIAKDLRESSFNINGLYRVSKYVRVEGK
jgi:hypothetical protein